MTSESSARHACACYDDSGVATPQTEDASEPVLFTVVFRQSTGALLGWGGGRYSHEHLVCCCALSLHAPIGAGCSEVNVNVCV